jgi:putative transposase
MVKSYKYRIYPTNQQRVRIDKTISCCRLIYNLALETKIRAYKDAGVNLSEFALCYQLVELKREFRWLYEADSQALKASIRNLEVAFKSFYNGCGYPKFKKKYETQTYQCPNGKKEIDFDKQLLTIPKNKGIPIRLSRRFFGKIKTITIIKSKSDKYFASILVDTIEENIACMVSSRGIGIDLGINSFATLSTGEKIDNPRFLLSSIKRLKVLQRRASRKKIGSNNRKKANLKVSLLHEKITNQRSDFLHKVSTKLIRDNQTDTICVETLSVKNMVQNRKLSQAISDAGWSEFIRQLEYKGKWYGKNVIKVNRFYASSKICSNCGHKLDQLDLDVRKWICDECDTTHDRDINAAINIKNSGMGNAGVLVEQSALMGCDETRKKAKIPVFSN